MQTPTDDTPRANDTTPAYAPAAAPDTPRPITTPDLARYPRTESGRILPRWVVQCPFVEAHYITHAPRHRYAESTDALHPALLAWREAPQGNPMRRVWEAYTDTRMARLRVYAVHNVAPETWATLAAWYSRSPRTLRQNLLHAILCGDIRLPDGLVQNVPSPIDGDDGCAVKEHADGGFSITYEVWDSDAERFAPVPAQYRPAEGAEACPEGLHADPRWAPPTVEGDGMLARARAFHERWTVGYGHASVAEGAVVYLCVDGCSMLAAKALEEARIGASYTEKSSRYVDFRRAGFVSAEELGVPYFAPEAEAYDTAMWAALTAYEVASSAYTKAAATLPGADTASPAALRGWVFDRARDHLPCGARTGLAMTLNARALAHHIRRLRGPMQSPEVQFLGALILDVAHRVCPSLVRHADAAPGRLGAVLAMLRANAGTGLDCDRMVAQDDRATESSGERVELHSLVIGGRVVIPGGAAEHPREVRRLATAVLNEQGVLADGVSVTGGADHVAAAEFYAQLLAAWSCDRDPHAGLSRAAEVVTIEADVTIPYGAWRDVQRHRTFTVTRPPRPDFRPSDPGAPRDLVTAAEGGGKPTPMPGDVTRWTGITRAQRHTLLAHVVGSPFRGYVGPFAPAARTCPLPGGVVDNYEVPETNAPAAEYATVDALCDAHPGLAPIDRGAHTMGSPAGAMIAYATPLASRVRVRISANLRAWAHFVELRSRREGHDDYRTLAQQMGDALMHAFPGLHLRVDREPRTFARK